MSRLPQILVWFFILSLFSQSSLSDHHREGVTLNYSHLGADAGICFVGDTGTGTSGQYRVAEAMLERGCRWIFIVGDMIYPDGIDSADDLLLKERFLDPYAKLFKQGAHFVIAVGNHDYRGEPEAWVEVARRHPQVIFPSRYFSMKLAGNLCFTIFDTNRGLSDQVDWSEEQTNGPLADCQLRIGMGHHPIFSSGLHGNAPFWKGMAYHKMTTGYQAYIAGHDHHLSDEGKRLHGKRLLITGAGAKLRKLRRKPQEWGVSKLGFIRLRGGKNSQQLRYEFIVVEKKGSRVGHSGVID